MFLLVEGGRIKKNCHLKPLNTTVLAYMEAGPSIEDNYRAKLHNLVEVIKSKISDRVASIVV